MVRFYVFLLLAWFVTGCQESASPARESRYKPVRIQPSPEVAFGRLFEAVQMAQVFPESQTFADSSPKSDPQSILAAYETEQQQPGFDLNRFVLRHFTLSQDHSMDFRADTTQSVLQHIRAIAPILTRQTEAEDLYASRISLPRPYLTPNAAWDDFRYQDSYFAVLGLQATEQWEAIQDVADNMAFLIQTVGYIPSGNRTYEQTRSHPPYFSMIIRILAEGKGLDMLVRYLPELEKEYAFWMAGADKVSAENPAYRRVVRMPDGTLLNRYWDDSVTPRAEAYREDVLLAQSLKNRVASQVYRDVRAAAESGWEVSARWFRDGKSVATLHTTELVPVDLNCLLWNLETTLVRAYTQQGNGDLARQFTEKAALRKAAVLKYFWNERIHFFDDFDFVRKRHSGIRSLAATFPLFLKVASQVQADSVSAQLERDFLQEGGLVSTIADGDVAWDATMGIAPWQWTGFVGLRNYGHQRLAARVRQRWMALNTRVFRATGNIFRRYRVTDHTLPRDVNEPLGYGWTNGVFLAMDQAKSSL